MTPSNFVLASRFACWLLRSLGWPAIRLPSFGKHLDHNPDKAPPVIQWQASNAACLVPEPAQVWYACAPAIMPVAMRLAPAQCAPVF